MGESSHFVMAKLPDWEIVVRDFKLKSRYYLHFWTNTQEKNDEFPYLPAVID